MPPTLPITVGDWAPLQDWLSVMHNADGTFASPAASYVLASDGVTVTARNGNGSLVTSAASLHTIIAALPANVDVYLGLGTFPTTAELVSKAGMTIRGSGLGTVIQKQANISIIRVNAANFTMRDLVLDGNQAGGFTGQCINNSSGGDDLTLENCIVKNANVNGIVSGNCSRVQILNSKFSGNQQRDVFFNPTSGVSRDCKVTGCHLDGTGTTGAFSRLTASPGAGGTADCNGLQVLGNTITGSNNSGAFCLDLALGSGVASTGWLVSGNVARLSGNALGGYSFATVGAGTAVGNTFDVNGFNATTAAIEFSSCTGITITGNMILGGTTLTCGVVVDGSAASSGHVISGNTINGLLSTAVGAIRVIANNAGSVFNDIVIIGNNIVWGGAGTGISGIIVQTNNASAHADRVLISGNNVRGNNAATTKGITLNNNALGVIDKCLIIGNCNTNVATAISQTGDTNTLVPAGTNQS